MRGQWAIQTTDQPIDCGWELLQDVHAVLYAIHGHCPADYVKGFVMHYARALDMVSRHPHRSGDDFVHGPCVLWLPPQSGGVSFEYAFVFKQSDNGITFVVAPHRMPWIDED